MISPAECERQLESIGYKVITKECCDDFVQATLNYNDARNLLRDINVALLYLEEDYPGFKNRKLRKRIGKIRREIIERGKLL